MNKTWIILCLVLVVFLLQARVDMRRTDSGLNLPFSEENHQAFEYFILPLPGSSGSSSECQAIRIGSRWFATAAHCVQKMCQKGCRIQLDLRGKTLSALAEVAHTPDAPSVFIHPNFVYNIFVKNDLAFFRMDIENLPWQYFKRENSYKRTVLSPEQARQFLAENPSADEGLVQEGETHFPPLLVVDDHFNSLFRNVILVQSVFGGERLTKWDPYPVHYVADLNLAYTENFGIRRGMSGAGVRNNKGNLVGIVSGVFQASKTEGDGSYTLQDELCMFSVFDKSAVRFMKKVMGKDFAQLNLRNAYPAFAVKSHQDYTEIKNRMKKVVDPLFSY